MVTVVWERGCFVTVVTCKFQSLVRETDVQVCVSRLKGREFWWNYTALLMEHQMILPLVYILASLIINPVPPSFASRVKVARWYKEVINTM